jgi:hypothetical protein
VEVKAVPEPTPPTPMAGPGPSPCPARHPASAGCGVQERHPAPPDLRREALAPLLQEFAALGLEKSGQAPPTALALGGLELELGVWERSVVRRAAAGGDPDGTALLAECLAFQVRCRRLLDTYGRGPLPPPAELPRFVDGMITDVAVGLALQEELQREIGGLVQRGDLAGAKDLAAFRHKIVQAGVQIRDRMGRPNFEKAERRAKGFIAPQEKVEARSRTRPQRDEAPAPAPPVEKLVEHDEEPEFQPQASWQEACLDALKGQPAVVHTTEVKRERRSILKPMLLALATLCLVWAVFILPRLLSGVPPPPVLTIEQFADLHAVVAVDARPPSLYVQLDDATWNALPPAEREELLQRIGDVANRAGYHGIHARTTQGAPAGQWLRDKGVRVYEPSAESS